jgi:hypothetical protein
MARVRKAEEERSMDSLMDAMTNVVGFLLLILIVSSIGISEAVRKVVSNIQPVSEQELQILKSTRESTLDNLKKLRDLQTNLDAKKQSEADAQNLILELAEFEKNNQELMSKTSDIESWRQKVEQEEAKKKTNEEEVKVVSTEVASLKAALDQTPKPEVKDAKIVKMPNPRLAPDQAVAYFIVCTGKKLYFIGDPYDHVFRVRDVIDQNFASLAYSNPQGLGSFAFPLLGTKQNEARTGFAPLDETIRVTSRMEKDFAAWMGLKLVGFQRGGADPNFTYTEFAERTMWNWLFGNEERRDFSVYKMRLDEGKVKAYFGDGAKGPPDLRYFVERSGTSDRLKLSIGFKPEGGWDAARLTAPNSEFQNYCRQATVNRGSLFYYYVAPDSFEIYLQAREISESFAIPAGWTTWKGERLELRAMSPRQTVRFNLATIPVAEYRKIADTAGPAIAKTLTDEVKKLTENVAAAVPADVTAPADKQKFIDQLTQERKTWIHNNLQPWTRQIFEAALAATEVKGEKEIQIDVHPPEIPHTRIFVGQKPPTKPTPPPDPNAPKKKAPPAPGTTTKLILD